MGKSQVYSTGRSKLLKQTPFLVRQLRAIFILIVVSVLSIGMHIANTGNVKAATLDIELELVATGYSAPSDIASTGIPGDDRLFIVEQGNAGIIRILHTDGTKETTPFLDLPNGTVLNGGERGLLGLAFHPNYASNRYFYISYTRSDNALVVARYTRDANNPDLADINSGQTIIVVPHPDEDNHNGGDLNFGPDGYLYIGTGDGGGGGNPSNSSQNLESLQGKLLRLDVDSASPYAIPEDNPFVGTEGEDEIWAYGLRNPWRFSFDRETGDLWIGDVGQGQREEINFLPSGTGAGTNFGWRCYEGTTTYNTAGCGPIGNYTFPIGEYTHGGGRCSVTGGFVYRGNDYPAMKGHYFFGDYCSGELYTLTSDGSGGWEQELQTDLNINMTTFGEDSSGELYVAQRTDGNIFRLTTSTEAPEDTTPPTTSITSPINGAEVSETILITADSSDDVEVDRVEFRIDGELKSTDSTPPYSYSWDTTTVEDGEHTITSRAYDTSDNVTTSSTVTVTVQNDQSNPLPNPWVGTDIGNVGTAGSASYSGGVFTLNGAGSTIGGTADSFHFVHQTLNGDGQITARLTSIENNSSQAEAGIMIRSGLGNNDVHVSLTGTPTASGDISFKIRATDGSTTTTTVAVENKNTPYWLRLQRQGTTIASYWSTNGTDWEHIINTTLDLNVNNYVGLVVSSHDTDELNTSTFDNVEFLAGGDSPPVIDIINPGHTGVYSGIVDVEINVVDANGIDKVEYYVDGTLVHTDNSAPFTYAWNTFMLTNGNHILGVTAYDENNNNSTHTHVVEVQNESVFYRSDFNNSGTVNFSDLLILLSSYGQNVTPGESGDLNGDGNVTFADILILLSVYNT